MDLLKPLELEKWETQDIKIHWNDGHISQYRSGWLRARCPCASCQEEANKSVAQPTSLNLLPVFDPSSEQLASLKPTGQYAYNIAFKGSVRLTALLGQCRDEHSSIPLLETSLSA